GAPATVRITRSNSPPFVAFINTPFQAVPLLLPVTLQAVAFDNDGDPLTYQWGIVSSPSGSAAALATPTSFSTTFAPDVVGTYIFSLVVSDPVSSSNQAQGSVTVVDLPPTARIGPDQAVTRDAIVTLDGSASSDPSNRPLTFAWTLQRPAGSSALLSDAA